MCFLKIYSDTNSFKSFAQRTKLPVYSVDDKGENKKRNSDYRISLDVSDKDWSDFDGQVQECIVFLTNHFEEIELLLKTHNVTTACLDFPIYSRLYENIVNQNDYLPKERAKNKL